MYKQSEIQIGKSRLTEGIIENLKTIFKTHKVVKISVLKSARNSRDDVKKIAEEIADKLGKKYTYRIIGFVIILRKWRKEQR